MKTATIAIIKKELKEKSTDELMELCLRLAKFKTENKELLTYLLFESHDDTSFIEAVKNELELQFCMANSNSYFYIKKSVRKILSNLKKYCRYAQNKETELILLMYFCNRLKDFDIRRRPDLVLENIYKREKERIKKLISELHEDLQFDYKQLWNSTNTDKL